MIKITEKRFQSQIIRLAEMRRWRVYHPWSSMHSVKGYPDLTMVRGKSLIVAELKTEKGQVTDAQQGWLDAFHAMTYCQVFVWRPSDWPEIERILR